MAENDRRKNDEYEPSKSKYETKVVWRSLRPGEEVPTIQMPIMTRTDDGEEEESIQYRSVPLPIATENDKQLIPVGCVPDIADFPDIIVRRLKEANPGLDFVHSRGNGMLERDEIIRFIVKRRGREERNLELVGQAKAVHKRLRDFTEDDWILGIFPLGMGELKRVTSIEELNRQFKNQRENAKLDVKVAIRQLLSAVAHWLHS